MSLGPGVNLQLKSLTEREKLTQKGSDDPEEHNDVQSQHNSYIRVKVRANGPNVKVIKSLLILRVGL